LLGPLCHAVDKRLFKTFPAFVKGSDPTTWPDKMLKLFGESPVIATDFSSFEAHHRGIYSEIVSFWMEWSLSSIEGYNLEKSLIHFLIRQVNEIDYRGITTHVKERLMSGALWTSSSNGLLDFLLMSFMCVFSQNPLATPDELVLLSEDWRGLVEGDDGICADEGFDESLIPRLGLKLKLERFPHFSRAGFCQIYCDPFAGFTVKDPKKVLQNFFALPLECENWRLSKVSGYFRAKALSYKYLFGNAPIVGPLMDWVLSRTRDHAPMEYRLHLLQDVPKDKILQCWKNKAVVPDAARYLVGEVFGLPPQFQLDFEASLDDRSDVIFFDFPFVTEEMRVYARTHLRSKNMQAYLDVDRPARTEELMMGHREESAVRKACLRDSEVRPQDPQA